MEKENEVADGSNQILLQHQLVRNETRLSHAEVGGDSGFGCSFPVWHKAVLENLIRSEWNECGYGLQ